MSEQDHLSVEQIADLLEQPVGSAKASAARQHLAACAVCSAAADDQRFVAALLAEEGRTPEEVPPDVAAALDAALAEASAGRSGRVTSLDGARGRRTASRSHLGWLSAAAAVVVLCGAGVAAWQLAGGPSGSPLASGHSPTSTSVTSTGGTSETTPHTAKSTDVTPPTIIGGRVHAAVRPVSAQTLPARARQLAEHPGQRVAPGEYGCRRPGTSGDVSVVVWDHRQAVLAIHPAARTAAVYDCKTASHRLYSTSY